MKNAVDNCIYVIRATGELDPKWSDRMSGMQIRVDRTGRDVQTELVGRLPDQAALMSVLNELYEQGLAVVAVEQIGN